MRFLVTILTSILFLFEIQRVMCDDVMTKNFYDGEAEPIQEERHKKPFCNAFTGCGRKRADDSLGTIFDYNAGPMNNFNRQIPMNVRLPVWIALQNARSSKKSNDWILPSRQFEHPFFNYRRKRRCGLDNYLC